MNSEAILAIGGVVGGLSKFLMMGSGIRGRWVTVIAVIVTTLVFAVWGYSHNDFARETTWAYFMAWVETLSIAAGAFHGTEQAVEQMNGTGDGSRK